MRKTFFIVGLLALLLFGFTVVANAAPPGAHEDDDGSWTILHNDFVEQVLNWFTDLQSSAWPRTINEVAIHNHELAVLREAYLIERLNAILQAIRINVLSE